MKVPPHAFTGQGKGMEDQMPTQTLLKSWRWEIFFPLAGVG